MSGMACQYIYRPILKRRCGQDTLQPKADQVAEEGIKPAGKAAKDAVQKAQDQIPEPETSRKVAEENVSKAAKPAAQAVKDNAQPLADKVCSSSAAPS